METFAFPVLSIQVNKLQLPPRGHGAIALHFQYFLVDVSILREPRKEMS